MKSFVLFVYYIKIIRALIKQIKIKRSIITELLNLFLCTYEIILTNFFSYRARPSKYISKAVIICIWVLAILLASPIAYALRVEDVEEMYASKY